MKKLKIVMYVEVKDIKGIGEDKVIEDWISFSIDDLIHESFDEDDHLMGEVTTKVVETEITDV